MSEWLKYNKQHPSRNRRKDKHGFAPVHYAAKFNRPEIMTLLCKEGGVGRLNAKLGATIFTRKHDDNPYMQMSVRRPFQRSTLHSILQLDIIQSIPIQNVVGALEWK